MIRFLQTFQPQVDKFISRLALSVMVTVSSIFPLAATEIVPQQLLAPQKLIAESIGEPKRRLSEKFYRQALYFYFQNQFEQALSQLDYNQQRFGFMSEHARLFEAGLQSKQGMLIQAQQSLESLLAATKNTDALTGQRSTSGQEILAIVLLQIAEQKLTLGENKQAAKILAEIKLLPQNFVEQFSVLHQLLAWPKSPVIHYPTIIDMAGNKLKPAQLELDNSPYVRLNRALVLIETQQYQAAELLLQPLIQYQTSTLKSGFWQSLFSEQLSFFDDENTENKALVSASNNVNSLSVNEQQQIETNGIQNYAKLLLAQLYIQQDDYEQSYQLLSTFPKNSVFSEQALFIFGYSASQLKKYQQAQAVFNLLVKHFPYSTYSRQALALIAGIYVEQQALPEALNQYLIIEAYYQNKLQSLAKFAEQLNQTGDVLIFSEQFSSDNSSPLTEHEHQLWLSLALTDDDINQSLQALRVIKNNQQTLFQQANKSAWLGEIIKLNNIRKSNISAQQSEQDQQVLLTKLTHQVDKLTERLALAQKNNDARIFANPRQQLWLKRIGNSHNIIGELTGKKNTDDYLARLKRVEGVLQWQLQQSYPAQKWHHQTLLKTLTKTLEQTKMQFEQVNNLLTNASHVSRINDAEVRVINSDDKQLSQNKIADNAKRITAKITALSQQNKALKYRANQQSLTLINAYIKQQEQALEQHLLYCQNQMANLIEQLNREERL